MSFLEIQPPKSRRKRIRLLRCLSAADAKLVRKRHDNQLCWILQRQSDETGAAWDDDFIQEALAFGVVEQSKDLECRINKAGRSALRRALSGQDGFADQHRILRSKPQTGRAVTQVRSDLNRVKTNLNESPLTRLAARRGKNGQPLLAPEQVRAGERLRADYTFAAMMPAIGQGWRTERSGTGPGQSGLKDLNDDVLSARQRVERILASIEPVLAGVLVDVCCHLKGLEKIEAERGWPARCAKIVLQIGLSALADRYGERTQAAAGHGRIKAWSVD